jgi:hypothetical protein
MQVYRIDDGEVAPWPENRRRARVSFIAQATKQTRRSAALGSYWPCSARTPASMRPPRSLSMLCQYSNARCRTGSLTPSRR